MDHELNNKIEKLVSKFENGWERYHKSAMFNSVINSMVRGADPLHIIDQVLKANDSVHDAFQKYVEGDTSPKRKREIKINNYYAKSIGGERKDFIDFVKDNNQNLDEIDVNDIDFLIQRVAQNLFYFEDNVSTAKSDYISLIGLLMKKGVVFEDMLGG
jgi:hypothetical protein